MDVRGLIRTELVRVLNEMARGWPVLSDADGRCSAFMIRPALCVVGVTSLEDGQDWFDIRRRVFMASRGPDFDLALPMRDNARFPESPMGLVHIDDTDILTTLGCYRCFQSWGAEEIKAAFRLQFLTDFGVLCSYMKRWPGLEIIPEHRLLQIWHDFGATLLTD